MSLPWRAPPLLNEVLSLNAQECHYYLRPLQQRLFLNEVLSLNAQELARSRTSSTVPAFLNEVLSLNAQEFVCLSAVQITVFPQ